MDLKLPEPTVVSAENARQLEKRFKYLWSAAVDLLPTNAVLAGHLMAQMMQLVRSNRAQLPQNVLDYVCERCGALMVPSISADVKVVPQSRKSPANRRLAKQQRQNGGGRRVALVNVVRVRCHRCKHANDSPGATVVHKAKTKKRAREEEESTLNKKLKTETAVGPVAPQPVPGSMFAPPAPPSPPRKLLDGPKRKKKKKAAQPDAAVTAVKSSLNSFLQSLKPSSKQ